MKILATDLDRTLLPNGSWKADKDAIKIFNKLTKSDDILVVYVTGRNLLLTENAIKEYGVRYPNILCGDVGTTIRMFENGKWEFDTGWVDYVKSHSPKWDAKAIKNAVSGLEGIREQETEHQNQFKQSYYVDHKKKEQILSKIDELIKGKYDEVIIYSFDSMDSKGLIDFLPNSATKQTALEYVAKNLCVEKKDVVFCGDSGNDIFPLTAGFSGVLVKNADEQLVKNVKKAMEENPNLEVYFANGDFKGLSGYYTSGIIEGAYKYGIFKEDFHK